jgi:large subunit ribosomal protein L33
MAAVSIIIKLESSAGTGYFYTTKKNPRNVQKKLELKRYDPVIRKHVIFNEKKVKS